MDKKLIKLILDDDWIRALFTHAKNVHSKYNPNCRTCRTIIYFRRFK